MGKKLGWKYSLLILSKAILLILKAYNTAFVDKSLFHTLPEWRGGDIQTQTHTNRHSCLRTQSVAWISVNTKKGPVYRHAICHKLYTNKMSK